MFLSRSCAAMPSARPRAALAARIPWASTRKMVRTIRYPATAQSSMRVIGMSHLKVRRLRTLRSASVSSIQITPRITKPKSTSTTIDQKIEKPRFVTSSRASSRSIPPVCSPSAAVSAPGGRLCRLHRVEAGEDSLLDGHDARQGSGQRVLGGCGGGVGLLRRLLWDRWFRRGGSPGGPAGVVLGGPGDFGRVGWWLAFRFLHHRRIGLRTPAFAGFGVALATGQQERGGETGQPQPPRAVPEGRSLHWVTRSFGRTPMYTMHNIM